ncbi:MAG TPA: cytochrome c oxidase assembly protein [Acidimicrobiales bacterium]
MSEVAVQGFFARREIAPRSAAVAGLLLWLLFIIPPLSTWSSQYEFVQAIQFSSFAIVVPALLVIGRPWRWLGLASGEPLQIGSDGELIAMASPRLLDRAALRRTKHQSHQKVIVLLIVFMVQAIVWRLSPVVNALGHHKWLAIVESLSLIVAGVLLWIELIESMPLSPSATRPYRIGVSLVATWTVWVVAYVMAMSHNSWNPVLAPHASLVLSRSADQQLAAALMWFLSAVAFVPLVFLNLFRWLRSEEDPSDELYQLVRKEQARGFFGPKS